MAVDWQWRHACILGDGGPRRSQWRHACILSDGNLRHNWRQTTLAVVGGVSVLYFAKYWHHNRLCHYLGVGLFQGRCQVVDLSHIAKTDACNCHRLHAWVMVCGRSWDRLYLAASDGLACMQLVALVIRGSVFCDMQNGWICEMDCEKNNWNYEYSAFFSRNTHIQESNQWMA